MIRIALDDCQQGKQFDYPWTHWVIDNFLPKEIYDQLVNIKDSDDYELVDMSDGRRTTKINPIANKEHIRLRKNNKVICQELKSITLDWISKLLINEKKLEWKDDYRFVFDLVKCEPKYCYQKHVDHKDKILSIVVYLHPEEGNGTILLDEINQQYDVVWKPNRALLFMTNSHAFHYYKNKTHENRYSLNVYVVEGPWEFEVTNKGPNK